MPASIKATITTPLVATCRNLSLFTFRGIFRHCQNNDTHPSLLSPVVAIQFMTKITKEEAARILDATPRTVERLAKSNRLSVTYEKGATRDVPVYDEDEVKALAKQPRTAAQPAIAPPAPEPSQAIATRNDNGDNRLSQAVAFLIQREHQRMTEPVATISDLAHKLTLSLVEAALVSGLSRGHLREAIEAKKLKARIIGRGWKVKRDDLDLYVKKL